MGADVYVSFTIPVRNVDGTMPADVGRVELYAVTDRTPPAAGEFLAAATRVAVVPVDPPDEPGDGPSQGSAVTLRDRLADAVPVSSGAGDDGEADGTLRRFYAVIAYSARGVSTGTGPIVDLPMTRAPDAPSGVTARHDADGVQLAWIPPPAAKGAGPGDVRYNVYRVSQDSDDAASPAWAAAVPVPQNSDPLDAPAFTESTPLDGVERCYVVRSVGSVESGPSAPACVTPVDVFPPAAPRRLSAAAAPGGISLIWEPNEDPDLAGYLVLRGEAGDATLAPLADTPVRGAQFVDRTVVSGRRYVYAVVAVDTRAPTPNRSAESERVAVTAR